MRLPKRKKVSVAAFRSRKQEREVAGRIGGKTIVASGAFDDKGDVKSEAFRVECKSTCKKSFSVTLEMLNKIEEAAMGSAQIPFMEIEFLSEAGKKLGSYAIMPGWALDMFAKTKQL